MTEIKACVNGIYPRSKALVGATRDYDRGRLPVEALEKQFRQDLKRLIALQQEAGLDPLSDGLLCWQDLFRPLVESCEGLAPGPLARFFDNNTFYRQPVIRGSLRHRALPVYYYNVKRFPPAARWKATLPSPYAFSRMAEDPAPVYRDPNERMLALAEKILRPEAERLVREGCALIQLQEPYWVHPHTPTPGAEDRQAFREAIRLLAEGVRPRAKLLLHTYFGDVGPWAEELLELEIDGLGVDFLETDLEDLPRFEGKELLCGCLDARSSLVEDPKVILRFLEQVLEKLAPTTLYVTSNADLEFLPEPIAREKVRLMGSLVQRLAKEGA